MHYHSAIPPSRWPLVPSGDRLACQRARDWRRICGNLAACGDQGRFQIGDQIVRILDADRDAQQVVGRPRALAFHGLAVFDQAFVMLHNHYIEDLMKVSANQRNLRLMQHESFLRGWAARQLADLELPTIELKGMEVLLGLLVDNRQIDARNNAAMVQARADAYAVTAMLLGWVLCRRNLSLALETDEAVLLSYLLPIQKYIQKGH